MFPLILPWSYDTPMGQAVEYAPYAERSGSSAPGQVAPSLPRALPGVACTRRFGSLVIRVPFRIIVENLKLRNFFLFRRKPRQANGKNLAVRNAHNLRGHVLMLIWRQ